MRTHWLPLGHTDVLRAIAEEAAMNHLMQRPLEVRGATVAALEEYFDELGLRLVDALGPVGDVQLLGGRYCSLRGVTAAQLRQRDAQGRKQTLYQVRYDAATMGALPDARHGAAPLTLHIRGLHVDLWVDRGLLFALTRE